MDDAILDDLQEQAINLEDASLTDQLRAEYPGIDDGAPTDEELQAAMDEFPGCECDEVGYCELCQMQDAAAAEMAGY